MLFCSLIPFLKSDHLHLLLSLRVSFGARHFVVLATCCFSSRLILQPVQSCKDSFFAFLGLRSADSAALEGVRVRKVPWNNSWTSRHRFGTVHRRRFKTAMAGAAMEHGGREGGGKSDGDAGKAAVREPYIAVVAYLLRAENIVSSPREELYEDIQSIRQQWDDAFSRWIPHVTLVAPFVVDDEAGLDRNCEAIAGICNAHQRHDLDFGQVGRFKLNRYTNVHLKPMSRESHQALSALQSELRHAIGHAHAARGQSNGPQGRRRHHQERPFSPHISLGQARSDQQLERLEKLGDRATSRGVVVTVGSIALLAKPQNRSGEYDVWREFDLAN